MRIQSIALVLAFLGAGSAHAQGKKAQPATPPGHPQVQAVPTPKKATAEVVLRDPSGKETQRFTADTAAKDVKALCAYAEKEPMPDTLAFAIGVEDKWQIRAQLGSATTKKPALQEMTLLLASGDKSVLSWTGGAEACTMSRSQVSKTGDVKLTLKCSGVGSTLGQPYTLEAKFDAGGCPKM